LTRSFPCVAPKSRALCSRHKLFFLGLLNIFLEFSPQTSLKSRGCSSLQKYFVFPAFLFPFPPPRSRRLWCYFCVFKVYPRRSILSQTFPGPLDFTPQLTVPQSLAYGHLPLVNSPPSRASLSFPPLPRLRQTVESAVGLYYFFFPVRSHVSFFWRQSP